MAGFGFNNRARAANDMRGGGMGLGLGRPRMETSEYRPGDRDPQLDAEPEMGQDDQYGPPGQMVGDADDAGMGGETGESEMDGDPGMGGDGWDDNERAFRDQVEQDEDSELYAKMQEWKRKWTGRAKEFGLDESQAMRVLDSIGDLDAQSPGDPGYGQDDEY